MLGFSRLRGVFCIGLSSIWFAMVNFVRSPPRTASSELIAKLVKAGYLQPPQRNDPDAVSRAIFQMRQELRGVNDADDGGPAAV